MVLGTAIGTGITNPNQTAINQYIGASSFLGVVMDPDTILVQSPPLAALHNQSALQAVGLQLTHKPVNCYSTKQTFQQEHALTDRKENG